MCVHFLGHPVYIFPSHATTMVPSIMFAKKLPIALKSVPEQCSSAATDYSLAAVCQRSPGEGGTFPGAESTVSDGQLETGDAAVRTGATRTLI